MKPSSLHEILIIRDEIIFMQKNGYKTNKESEIYATKTRCIKKGKERPFVNFKFTRNRD